MQFLKLNKIVAALVVASTPMISSANESTVAPPEEGFWSGGYKTSKGASIQFAITAVDRIGKLEVDAKGWQGFEFIYKCEYVFAVDDSGIAKCT